MHPIIEEFLWGLLDAAEFLSRPTYGHWTSSRDRLESFHRFNRRIDLLAQRGLVEARPAPSFDRIIRLTSAGRLHAIGGRDPLSCWNRSWDGNWRAVIFDLPASQTSLRQKLTRKMISLRFGHLQWSAWISPDPLTEVRECLQQTAQESGVFLCLDGRPAGGESDENLVTRAWDFELINRRYAHYLSLRSSPYRSAKAEWRAWRSAVNIDPFLPRILHPPGYLGVQAWEARSSAR